MAESIKNRLRIVAYPEGSGWIAQCVEYDICAQGDDLPSVQRNMQAALFAECDYTKRTFGEPFKNIDRAPAYIETLYEEAKGAALQSDMNFRIAA